MHWIHLFINIKYYQKSKIKQSYTKKSHHRLLYSQSVILSNVCKTLENMQSKERMQSQKFNINTVHLPTHTRLPVNVKQQKIKLVTIMLKRARYFELITQPATLSTRYAVWSVQIKFGDLAKENLQQPSLSLPACLYLASSICMYLILLWLKRKFFKVPSCR